MRPVLKAENLIIFDWDGTIVDSFDTIYEFWDQLAERFCFRHLTKAEHRDLYNDNFYKSCGKTLKLPMWRIFEIIPACRKMLIAGENRMKPYPKMAKTLKNLAKNNVLAIVSSNFKPVIERSLEDNKLEVFNDVLAVEDAFSKVTKIRYLLRKYRPERVYFVCDSTGDINDARKASTKKYYIETVAVTWGFHSRKKLKEAVPDFIVSNIEQLEKLFMK